MKKEEYLNHIIDRLSIKITKSELDKLMSDINYTELERLKYQSKMKELANSKIEDITDNELVIHIKKYSELKAYHELIEIIQMTDEQFNDRMVYVEDIKLKLQNREARKRIIDLNKE